jgi:hypothetical protein
LVQKSSRVISSMTKGSEDDLTRQRYHDHVSNQRLLQ